MSHGLFDDTPIEANKHTSDESNGAVAQNSSTENDDDDDLGWMSAPPTDYIETIKGYELVSFDAVNIPPPPLPPPPSPPKEGEAGDQQQQPQDQKQPLPQVALESDCQINEEQAQEALIAHLEQNHCCYGKGAAKNMVVKKLEYLPAYHYELQTFSEKRETAWTYSPLRSSADRYSSSAPPPLPWEIEEQPTQPFKDEVKLVPVPGTSNVKSCHRCRGTGGVVCKDCSGKGWFRCIHCHGNGYLSSEHGEHGHHGERCFYCQHSKHGHGQQDCTKCNTKGRVNCAFCDGQGHIRCYIQLSITWKVHTAEHITEKLDLPHELIRDVSGQVVFEEEKPLVEPLQRVPDQGIKDASIKLVAQHHNSLADQRIVAQRHQIRIVPVTQVTYEWKGRLHSFFVYGYENKVHLTKYPQDCCWGCQLL